MLNGVPIDAGFGAIADEQRHRTRPNNQRYGGEFDLRRTEKIAQEDGVESVGGCSSNDGRAFFARRRQNARQIERHADA